MQITRYGIADFRYWNKIATGIAVTARVKQTGKKGNQLGNERS